MPRPQRYHNPVRDEDDGFETPALSQAAAADNQHDSEDSEDDLQSESGLGESPEEYLLETAGQLSDDDAPEDVDFADSEVPITHSNMSFVHKVPQRAHPMESSRDVETKRVQSIMEEIKKGREEQKDKRRKKDKLFKLQKQDKMAELMKRKLPEDMLQDLSQSSEKKSKTVSAKEKAGVKKQSQKKQEEDDDQDEDGDGFSSSDDEERLNAGEDYLALSQESQEGTRLKVVPLRKGGVSVAQGLADFKRAQLYGGRHKRVTNQQARLTLAKRKARR